MKNMLKYSLVLAGFLVLVQSADAEASDVVSTVWVMSRTSLTAEQVREINEHSQYGYDLVSTAPDPVSPVEEENGAGEGQQKKPPEETPATRPSPHVEPIPDAPEALDAVTDVPEPGDDDNVFTPR